MPFHSAGVDARRFAVPAAAASCPAPCPDEHLCFSVSVLLLRRPACLGLLFRVFGGSVPLLCLRHSSEGRERHGNRRARTNRIRIAPSSIDAERSVLGAMLQDSGAATLAFETLVPEDFYSAEHKEISKPCAPCTSPGNPVDLMTVGNELARRGTLDGVGGAPYLLQAVRFVPTTANTRTYIQIVQEKSTCVGSSPPPRPFSGSVTPSPIRSPTCCTMPSASSLIL